MIHSTEAQVKRELVIKGYWRKPEVFLLIATILKVGLILYFYQHVIDFTSSLPKIVPGYGWDQLVSGMYEGKYEMVTQSGLSDIYDLKSSVARPPIYPAFLFLTTYVSNYSTAVLVFLQSIITSLVAYLGYRIAKLSTNREAIAIICLWILFLFPMNFLKSGTIDDAPLMLVFVLASVYIFTKYIKNQDKSTLLIWSGILLGLSTMTRYTTLPIAVGLLLFILVTRTFAQKYRKMFLFGLVYIAILTPWIFRSYLIYGKPMLMFGGGRLLLSTQSEEFIETFPKESPDSIERRYLRSFHKSHEYLSKLDAFSLDKEFTRHAISEAINSPLKYCRAFVTKLKTFVPYRYYPVMDDIFRDIMYVSWYSMSLLFFLWSITRHRPFKAENILLLIAILGIILPGLVYFMLSRHLYPVIVLMIIFSFVSYPDRHESKKSLELSTPSSHVASSTNNL